MENGTVAVDGLQPAVVEVRPLTQAFFADFGTVVENPYPTLQPPVKMGQLPPYAVEANRGTAIKYQDVAEIRDLYPTAPSKASSRIVMNMFVCTPRELQRVSDETVDGLFHIDILERHPFTTQTFIPLGLSPAAQQESRYLVVVAPSLPLSPGDHAFPVPPEQLPAGRLRSQGLPDLTKIQAFVAKGSQAVMYGEGTWHAPMVVIGRKSIDFVVVQFANGVANEDCQEVLLRPRGQTGIQVVVPKPGACLIHSSPNL